MARPAKEGLDYFPLDIDFDQDDKLIVPVNKFGMQGLGVIVKLMGEIYRNGYYYPWGKREQYVFCNRVNVDINSINEVVNECLEWGFFNPDLFKKHQILTSKGFQKRYIEASKRRKMTTFIQEYTLIDLQEAALKCSPINEVDVNGNHVNVYINQDKVNSMSTESTQSKEKVKRKRNKKESNKNICDDPPTADHTYAPYHPDFERFWVVFPPTRKKDKAKAFETWKKKIKAPERESLIRCTELYANDFKAIGLHSEYAKMPTTYLNAGTYKDYLQGGEDVGYQGSEFAGGRQEPAAQYDEFGPPPPEPNDYYSAYSGHAPADGSGRRGGVRQEAPSDDDLFVRR